MLGSFLCGFQFDKVGVQFPDSPGRREAALTQFGPAPLIIPPCLAADTAGRCRALAKVPMLSHESIDKFARHQNVERYRRLLEKITDENQRDHLLKLFADAKQKQKDAEDPASLY
jgi:hypothetical protein